MFNSIDSPHIAPFKLFHTIHGNKFCLYFVSNKVACVLNGILLTAYT